MKTNFPSEKLPEKIPSFLSRKKWRTLSLKQKKMPKISKETLKLIK